MAFFLESVNMRNNTLRLVVQVLGFFLALATNAAYALTITVPDCATGQTFAFNSSTNTLSCSGSPPPPANTPGDCSISGNSSTQQNGITAGTLVQLIANCNTGLTPISYTWTIPNFGSVGPQAGLSTSPSQTTTYTVTPSNSAGNGSAFSTTVFVGPPIVGNPVVPS